MFLSVIFTVFHQLCLKSISNIYIYYYYFQYTKQGIKKVGCKYAQRIFQNITKLGIVCKRTLNLTYMYMHSSLTMRNILDQLDCWLPCNIPSHKAVPCLILSSPTSIIYQTEHDAFFLFTCAWYSNVTPKILVVHWFKCL